MKQIRLYIKNALIIVFSMIVMAAATGLSYKAHYCHGNLSDISFFIETGIQQTSACGCTIENYNGKQQPSAEAPVITKNSCCSNVSFFSKLNIESPVSYFSSISLVQPAIIEVESNYSPELAAGKENISITDFRSSPTPLAGRRLVLFLSQQRIPLINYNC